MSDYDNTNTGALFKNNRKEQETHSDYNGNLNVDGVEYWINAWLKTSKKGEKYMSLSVKAKGEQAPRPKAAEPVDEFSDQIPF